MVPLERGADAPWVVVVPVKRTDRAKTRLGEIPGVYRPDVALALACDTVAAALRCPAVAAVVVVTDDPRAAEATAALGADVVPDEPDAGQNPAVVHGITMARQRVPGCCVAALSADLPALRPDELGRALAVAREHPVSFVADAAGTGSTCYAVTGTTDPAPRFGARSRAAHRADGAVEIDGPLPGLRRDVDTPVDLWDALRLGVGPATGAATASLAGSTRPGARGAVTVDP
jgi:2-phospho-L-lactate guanylyltransferase